jgi:hypothetical protein
MEQHKCDHGQREDHMDHDCDCFGDSHCLPDVLGGSIRLSGMGKELYQCGWSSLSGLPGHGLGRGLRRLRVSEIAAR